MTAISSRSCTRSFTLNMVKSLQYKNSWYQQGLLNKLIEKARRKLSDKRVSVCFRRDKL